VDNLSQNPSETAMTEQPRSQGSSDPYEITSEAIVEPPRTFLAALRQIGPGLILTASIVGTGELIATTNLGAKAGLWWLWLVLLSCFIKVFVQIELGRYALASGKTTLAGFCEVPHMGDALCWWWLGMMLLTQFQIGAMIGGVAQALHLMLPGVSTFGANQLGLVSTTGEELIRKQPEIPWALLVTVVSIYLLVRGRYHVVERLCTWLVALFTLITVLCMVWLPFTDPSAIPVHPPATSVIASAIASGSPLQGQPWNVVGMVWSAEATIKADVGLGSSGVWLAAFAMIGITGVGASELIAYPYWCLEKRYARYVGPRDESVSWLERAQGWLGVMQLDAWVSMIIYTLATVAFFVLGAGVLFPHTRGQGLSEGSTGQLLEELATMYVPVLGHTGALWFICIGGFIVLYSTLFAATAGNSRVTTDFLRVQQLIPFSPQDYRIHWIRLFSGWFPILGLVLYLFVGNPVSMVIIGGVAQALTLPLIGAVAIFLRLRSTDRRLVAPGWWDVCLWLSLVVLTVAAAYGVYSQWGKVQVWLGG
jgi:manganese transport protein